MGAVLGLGFVDLALGILVMAPLSVGLRRHPLLATSFYLLFQVCVAIGMVLVLAAGLLAMAT